MNSAFMFESVVRRGSQPQYSFLFWVDMSDGKSGCFHTPPDSQKCKTRLTEGISTGEWFYWLDLIPKIHDVQRHRSLHQNEARKIKLEQLAQWKIFVYKFPACLCFLENGYKLSTTRHERHSDKKWLYVTKLLDMFSTNSTNDSYPLIT